MTQGLNRIVCISNGQLGGSYSYITVGKVYEVIRADPNSNYESGIHSVTIKNDAGVLSSYEYELFETLDMARNRKLKKLGI